MPSAESSPDVLAAAQRAVAAGRTLEAVDLLTALPSTARTAEVVTRSVDLRHRAFRELDRHPGRPSWPLELADPFPGTDGIPEIGPGELDGDVLGGALVHHGCLRVNNLLSRDRADRLCEIRQHALDEREQQAESGATNPGDWYVPFEPGRSKAEGFGHESFVRVVDVPRALDELVEAFAESGLTRAVTTYFNERPAMIANKWVLRWTSPVTEPRWGDFHQDGAFLGENIRTVDAWIALTACGPGTGATAIDLVPRRFDVLPTGDGTFLPWALSERTIVDLAGPNSILSPAFEPGDALLFDERLVHRTGLGPDVATRIAVESWFVAPSVYPDQHVPVVL